MADNQADQLYKAQIDALQAKIYAVYEAYINHGGDLNHDFKCALYAHGNKCSCGAWELVKAIEDLGEEAKHGE